MKKIIIGVVVVAVLAVGAFAIKNSISKKTSDTSSQTTPPAASDQSSSTNQGGMVVTYDGNSFSPTSLTIKVGDTVTFRNNSSAPMWVASNPHPSHTDYKGFDALRSFAKGEDYTFTFTKVGTWGFHNHLSPDATGTIVVQ
ncbi:MAG TPA: cupredoxin domain-containing protein [Candidatus Nanoarchaeia archaeon]|nr:cupredoxin domain-containing protein [Candidatus Nanoarchaeia archaeon]